MDIAYIGTESYYAYQDKAKDGTEAQVRETLAASISAGSDIYLGGLSAHVSGLVGAAIGEAIFPPSGGIPGYAIGAGSVMIAYWLYGAGTCVKTAISSSFSKSWKYVHDVQER